jgi:anti-sigma B factor antagonist
MRCAAERLIVDVTVLDLAARDGFAPLTSEVSDRVRALTVEGRTKFLLNFGEVSYLDSNGLGDLAKAHTVASGSGALVKLLNVQPRVADLLRTVNLWRVFESFASEQEALKSFR